MSTVVDPSVLIGAAYRSKQMIMSSLIGAAGDIDDLGKLIRHAKLLMTIDAKEKPE